MNRISPAKARKKVKKIVKPTKAKAPAAERLQYAALPWRKTDRLEIMLVSSRETRRWIIPKGWPMAGRSGSAAAGIEAMEEAGLLGVLSKEPIGQYFYEKRFSRYVQTCRVEVFSLRVVRQRDDWPEKHERSTQWFCAEEAKELVSEPELNALIGAFIRSFAN
jgi:8-oxo-dGTP pyrophosphatase MutT (NUDIX family)